MLPPAVEARAKRPVEDGAKDEMPGARAVEPAEEGLPRDVLDDDGPGLAVAVAGGHLLSNLDERNTTMIFNDLECTSGRKSQHAGMM